MLLELVCSSSALATAGAVFSTAARPIRLTKGQLPQYGYLGGRGTMPSPNISADNSRFGEINSRLGRPEFAVGAPTGIRRQRPDSHPPFRGPTAASSGKCTQTPAASLT